MPGNPLLKPKRDPLERISRIFFVIAMVLIFGYCGLAVKAVRDKQAEYKELYRLRKISRNDFEYHMEETTYLRMMLHPQDIIPIEKVLKKLTL